MLAVALGPPVMVTIPPGPDDAAVLLGGSAVLVPGVATAGWPIPSACHG